jgi:hypothetical protein
LLLLDAVPKASAKKQVGGGKKEIEAGGRGWRGGPISSGAATERTAPINPVQMLLLERTVSVGSSCVAWLVCVSWTLCLCLLLLRREGRPAEATTACIYWSYGHRDAHRGLKMMGLKYFKYCTNYEVLAHEVQQLVKSEQIHTITCKSECLSTQTCSERTNRYKTNQKTTCGYRNFVKKTLYVFLFTYMSHLSVSYINN